MLMMKENRENNFEAAGSKDSLLADGVVFKPLSRYRWNVLDLLELYGRKARSCHIFAEIDMSRVENLRQRLHERHQHATATAFLLKAISISQRDFPESRTQRLPFARQVTYDEIVAGFTVEREVMGQPAVFFGEIEKPCQKSISEISNELHDYGSKELCELSKLKEQVLFAELPWLLRRILWVLAYWFPAVRLRCMRATFGLSSLGALGITAACGPSVCTSVFGVGVVEPRVVADESSDQLLIKPMLTLALSYDQEVMDAAQAKRFLTRVKAHLENEIEY